MQWYEPEVLELEKRIKNGEIGKGANLFYGSSSLREWENIQKDFSLYQVENIAFGGSTIEACVYFFERLVVPCEPKSIIFYAGDNDVGNGVYHSDIMARFEALLTKRAKLLSGIKFTFISVKPSPARHALLYRIRLLNSYVKTRLDELENTHYIDIHTPMYTSGGIPNPELFCEDGLHMNANGYAIWREILLENAPKIFYTA